MTSCEVAIIWPVWIYEIHKHKKHCKDQWFLRHCMDSSNKMRNPISLVMSCKLHNFMSNPTAFQPERVQVVATLFEAPKTSKQWYNVFCTWHAFELIQSNKVSILCSGWNHLGVSAQGCLVYKMVHPPLSNKILPFCRPSQTTTKTNTYQHTCSRYYHMIMNFP